MNPYLEYANIPDDSMSPEALIFIGLVLIGLYFIYGKAE